MTAEIVVVGAGLIGSAVAWRLAREGRRVVLLDRGEPGAEASAAAGGALIPEAGRTSPELLRLYLDSLARFPGFVDEVRTETGAAFEYRAPGCLRLALDGAQEEALRAQFALQAPAGVRAEWVTGDEARRLEPAVTAEARGGIFFPDHALVDNGRLAPTVAQAAARAGAELRPYEGVLSIALEGGRVVGVETTRGRVSADAVVNAAGCWAGALVPGRAHLTRPAKGEMIALQAAPRPIERMVGMAGATVVPRADGRMMVGATRIDGEHSRDVSAAAVARMLAAAVALVPELGRARFAAAWAGLRPLTPDGMPILGPDHEIGGLYWATGHLGMGILSAPTTAEALAAVMAGREPPVPIGAFGSGRFAGAAVA